MASPHPERDAAIDQLCAITATETPMGRRSIEQVLRSTEWNVEQAANLIFSNPDTLRQQQQAREPPALSRDHTAAPTTVGTRPSGSKDRQRDPMTGGRPPPVGARVGIPPIRALTWPVRFILRLISGLWYLLVRNVLPLGLLPYMPRFLLPPSGGGSSSSGYPLSSRRLPFVDALRQECPDGYLPDFWRQGGDEDAPKGTYKEFLDHLKAERKVGCVVLCCSDHEDDLEFKRNVLTNEEFVKCLRENDILIWGADVREREGYQVSQTLQATTYPAISFFSLMPVTPSSSSGSSSSTSSNSKFTILTTVQGSPSTTTSTPSLIQLITTTIVPRTRPFLNRLRRERHALEEARRVREEQDRALAETERRDRDKILAIRRANEARARREREEALRVAEAREIEQREREQREKDLVDIREWRRYAKRYLLRQEPGLEQVKAKQAIRVQIRLPHGAPAVRAFPVHMDTAREVYIWAETLLLDGDGDEDTEARLPAGFSATEYPAAGRGQPHLELFTAYPRKHVSLDAQGWRTVVDAGGSLVMERPPWEQPGGDDSEEEEEEEG